jgi:hypothetical protein
VWLPSTLYTLRDIVAYLEEKHKRYGQQDATALARQCQEDLAEDAAMTDAHRLVGLMLNALNAGQKSEAVAYGRAALKAMEQQLPANYTA